MTTDPREAPAPLSAGFGAAGAAPTPMPAPAETKTTPETAPETARHALVRREPRTLEERVERSLDAAVANLLDQQAEDGYWCAELEGDSILESEYILLKWIIEQEGDPRLPKIANYLRSLQTEQGAWVQYPGAKPDISATVKGYFALKLMGDDPDAPHMRAARDLVGAAGGAEQCNSYTKFFLAALGQIRYDAVPSIPPEIILFPRWFYFSLDKVSAWTRTMITPLSIVTTHKPIRQIPARLGIDELYLSEVDRHTLRPNQAAPTSDKSANTGEAVMAAGRRTLSTVFFSLDKLTKLVERTGFTPLRERALKRIEEWIIERTDRSDGLGAIFPPMVYIHIALRCRGYGPDHPILVEAERHLDDLMIHDEDKDQIRIQPCLSPIWDTGIAAYALAEAGLDAKHPAMNRCAKWLVNKECRAPGDWVANVEQSVEPSGWYFEFNNGFYPDVDDTAMVAMALKRLGGGEDVSDAVYRGVRWLLAMQNSDGGWAAFDRTEHRWYLEHVPFADHNAIQDPSCPDITGRSLECLGATGYTFRQPDVAKAIEYIRTQQYPEGCWFGRWGVNYIYGTWQVLAGLRRVGYDMHQPWVQRAGRWLKSVQKADGSFGESADTYEDPSLKGFGPSTASQTAWGSMGLLSVFGPHDPDVKRGIEWLTKRQLRTGT